MENLYTKENSVKELMDMGFDKQHAELAFDKSENKSIEGLINWIDANPNPAESQKSNVGMDIEPTANEKEKPAEASSLEGESISGMVDQKVSSELQSMGYSKIVAEKALFFTKNNLEQALNWAIEHQADPDFEEELRIIKQEEKSTMSKEEAAQKARELQARIRENRAKKEKEDELERERNRIQSGKMLTEAKRAMEDQQLKLQAELKRKEKLKEEDDKRKMLEQLQRDREERFGKKFGAGGGASSSSSSSQEKEKTPLEKIGLGIAQVKTAHPNNIFPGMATTCFKTVKVYVDNILKNPQEEKFRKINLSNEAFQKRVGSLMGGLFILKNFGFEEKDGFLVLEKPDSDLISKGSSLLEKEI